MTPDWIAVDWGTTRLRVWSMRGAEVLDHRASDKGMGGLTPEGFEPALLELIADWLPHTGSMPIIACGMVGARTGWAEAEYRAIPCTPLDPARATRPPVRDPRLDIRILPGLSQAMPPDVLRGEETQIAGFLAQNPGFSGSLCLPGTHSKWVRLQEGQVMQFTTYMTGELFALISGQSVLRLSLGGATPDAEAVLGAGTEAMADPHLASSGLFALRAAALLQGLSPEQAAGRLSGILIGNELAAARAFWQAGPVVLIGAPALAQHYLALLLAHGAKASRQDGASLVLSGLGAAHRLLQEKT